jgi:RNA recognition motif-containing protein
MSKRLYVGNLPWSVTSSDLQNLFAEFGDVESAEVVSDRATGRSRGFGFVQMASDPDTQSAIDGLNGKDVDGRTIVVNEARERQPRHAGSRFRETH